MLPLIKSTRSSTRNRDQIPDEMQQQQSRALPRGRAAETDGRQEAAGHQEGGRTGMRTAAARSEDPPPAEPQHVDPRAETRRRRKWRWPRRRSRTERMAAGGSDVLRAAVEIRTNGADGAATAAADGADGGRRQGAATRRATGEAATGGEG